MKPNEFGSVGDLCRALVRIPSENPTGSPGSAGEGALAQFVGDYLTGLGAEVEFENAIDDRSNVYGRFPGPASAPRLMFAPHLDTVPVTGMTVDPFGAELRDGRIYGRGASDTKGPMAAMLWALKKMNRTQVNAEVLFAGLVDEEMGQLGAKVCAERHLADFVVVGEPTDLGVVYTHKGTCWLKLEAFGRAAHASAPELGQNAIERLGHVYAQLKECFPSLRPSNPHPTLGKATISLGLISGGSKINIVPDHCEAEIDIRTLPGQEGMAEAVQNFLTARQLPARVTVLKVSEPLFTNPEHPLVARLASLGAPLVGAPWFCDAACFAAAGTPAVAVGPGCIREAHTADEYIEVAELERGAAFFSRFLETFHHA